jgi:hypothetical protein
MEHARIINILKHSHASNLNNINENPNIKDKKRKIVNDDGGKKSFLKSEVGKYCTELSSNQAQSCTLSGQKASKVQEMQAKDTQPVIIADMMAGVGPFAIPLAMAGFMVYANGNVLIIVCACLTQMNLSRS